MASPGDKPLFTAHALSAHRLTERDAPTLQLLLERCHDYFEMVEGRRPKGGAALRDLRSVPAGAKPSQLEPLGLFAMNFALVGLVLAVRDYRRPRQWYLSLQLLEPKWRGRRVGQMIYTEFEGWARGQGADSILLSVVDVNKRASHFWEALGFGLPRCYPPQAFGRKRHVLIEYEKAI